MCKSFHLLKSLLTQNKKICVVDYNMNSIIYSTLTSVIAKVFTWNNNISHDEKILSSVIIHVFTLISFTCVSHMELWVTMLYKLDV